MRVGVRVGLAGCHVHEGNLGVDIGETRQLANSVHGHCASQGSGCQGSGYQGVRAGGERGAWPRTCLWVAADQPPTVVQDDGDRRKLRCAGGHLVIVILRKVDVYGNAELRRRLPQPRRRRVVQRARDRRLDAQPAHPRAHQAA